MSAARSEQRHSQNSTEPAIYNRVKVLRMERGYSRKELADELEINHRTLGYIEREDYALRLALAYRIANCFGLPLEAVFSQESFPAMSEQLYGSDHGDAHRYSHTCSSDAAATARTLPATAPGGGGS